MERASLQRAKLGADFVLLSGEDMTALGFNAHGGNGCISLRPCARSPAESGKSMGIG
jgi:dihydrodipicolinate synthase/N-acetylneuraminate lyase